MNCRRPVAILRIVRATARQLMMFSSPAMVALGMARHGGGDGRRAGECGAVVAHCDPTSAQGTPTPATAAAPRALFTFPQGLMCSGGPHNHMALQCTVLHGGSSSFQQNQIVHLFCRGCANSSILQLGRRYSSVARTAAPLSLLLGLRPDPASSARRYLLVVTVTPILSAPAAPCTKACSQRDSSSA